MRSTSIQFAILLLILGFVIEILAGDADRIGTAGGVQVLVPVGARDLALAGADIATSHGLDAIYWNPAGLASLKIRAMGLFSIMTIFNDIQINYLAIGVQAGKFGTLGFSLKSFDVGNISFTTNEDMDGKSGRTYSPTLVTGGMTYSRKLTDVIQIGVTGKVIYESIPRVTASAFAIDAGFQYQDLLQLQGLSIGLTIKNIGTNLQYSGSGLTRLATEDELGFRDFRNREAAIDQLPSTFELGLSYQRQIADKNQIVLAGTFLNQNYDNDNWKFGAEYTYNQLIFLRGGYLFTQNTPATDVLYTFTAGFGLNYNVGGVELIFDYAFRDSQYFSGNNLFSLMIGF
jgi:hypothetical protein